MSEDSERYQPVVLTIAGFDPSGGAGIIADVKTILHYDCRPVAALTSLTFQNSQAMFGATHESAESLRAQILPVLQETQVAAVKIGMIPTAEMVAEVARLISEFNLPAPVIDPVLRSTSDYELVEEPAIEVLKRELIPLARLITPNVIEAETLTGIKIESEQGLREAASKLRELGVRAVLVKGGHLPDALDGIDEAIDLLDDEGELTEFRGEWIEAPPVRGTGCMLSSAIAACLAQGVGLTESIHLAKEYVADSIRFAQNEASASTVRM